jgi:hypothetical protein
VKNPKKTECGVSDIQTAVVCSYHWDLNGWVRLGWVRLD